MVSGWCRICIVVVMEKAEMTGEVDARALRFVGGRVSAEPSRAAPAEFYGDPAKVVRMTAEKCTGCKYERQIMAGEFKGVMLCQRKDKNNEERKHGARCADFRQRGTK